jgi:hypothetical protein
VDDVVHEKLKGGLFPKVQSAYPTATPAGAARPEPMEEIISHGEGKKNFTWQ